MKNTALLFLTLCCLLPFGCKNEDECPFQPLEFVSTHERTEGSATFSGKVTLALSKVSKALDVQAATEIGASLRHLTEEYRNQPLDTLLAANFNYQIGIICGNYRCLLNEKLPSTERAVCAGAFSESVGALRHFMENYRDNRPIEPLIPSQKNFARPQTAVYASKIGDFLQAKIESSADEPERKKWQKMLQALPVWLDGCGRLPDCNPCLEEIWNQVKRLESSSS